LECADVAFSGVVLIYHLLASDQFFIDTMQGFEEASAFARQAACSAD
jgi:hypothetical protein